MHWPILIATLHVLSPSVINAEKGNEDDNWIDPFYMNRKFDTVTNDWMDPFDLEADRNWQHSVKKMENDIQAIPEERKPEGLVPNAESTEKVSQISENMQVITGNLKKIEGEDPERESEVIFGGNSGNVEKEEMCHCTKNEMEHNFLQRFVNLLVNKCGHINAEMQQKISVTLEISLEELKELQRLKDKKDVAPVIRLLHTVISDMKIFDHRDDHASFFHWILQLVSSKEVWMEIGVISFAISPVILFILGGRIVKILCITLLMTFSVSYHGTYRYMLLKVKEKNDRILSSTLACTPEERSWYHTVFGSNSDSDCQKRWNAEHIDPSVEVTPINVISHMVGVAVFQPLEQFGVMFSSFSSQIFDSQPFLRGMIVYMVAVLLIIVVILFCCYGIFGRARCFGSYCYSDTFTGHPPYDSDPAVSSIHPKTRNQVPCARTRSQVPGLLYEALPRQPVYIIHNYSDNSPKTTVTKTTRAKRQIPKKIESSSSKRKSGKRVAKNGCFINDAAGISNVTLDEIETTDDENEQMAPKTATSKQTRSDA